MKQTNFKLQQIRYIKIAITAEVYICIFVPFSIFINIPRLLVIDENQH